MIKSMADYRREYGALTLNIAGAEKDPFILFEDWLTAILRTDNYDPTAMMLSTVDENGCPDSRVVLLKGVENGEFLFYTNYKSTKAQQLALNPNVSLNFFWPFMARQIRIKGTVAKLNNQKNDDYFYSRPKLSQIAAIASEQSSVLASRQALENRMNDLIDKFGQEPILRPENWGGYTVMPTEIEFWQGRDNRLHDRLHYKKMSENEWQIRRLAP
jgi:pyridoxamine 5'-phosphate oxidase